MDFSDQSRSLWPVSSVFAPPNLLSGPQARPIGPFLFRPSAPALPLLSSPALACTIPPPLPPSSLSDGLRAFFRSPSNSAFLPSATLDALAAHLLPSPSTHPDDHLPANLLAALRSRRDPSTILLFFPTGANAHLIAHLSLSLKPSLPPPEVFEQRDGFKHPYHRIKKILVAPVLDSESSDDGDAFVEGFLIATTLYSVNWFRVETRSLDSGQRRPVLVPWAKQGFESCVADACWSPYFSEESAVLLESGELCWFNLDTMRGGKVEVRLDGGNPGGWSGCEYGGQPWVLLVACSMAVLMVDLRAKRGAELKVLARIEMPDMFGVIRLLEDERFVTFCKACYDDFHFSVVTEKRLLLFDSRQPLVPFLMWNHRLDHVSFVAMYRLSELRPSEAFKWASESVFCILVGSFWNDEFSLFYYGPRERGTLGNSSFYAWEIPSCFPLSGRPCGSGDIIVKDELCKDNLLNGVEWQRKDLVIGFCIVSDDLIQVRSEPTGVKGFALIRLVMSGKLEMQRYHASWDSYSEKSHWEGTNLEKVKDLPIFCMHQEGRVSTRYNFLKFRNLCEYMNGNLSSALDAHDPRLNYKKTDQCHFNSELRDLIIDKRKSSSLSPSAFVSDASVPMSIFEIASRRALTGLGSDLLQLAFSKQSELPGGNGDSYFEFLDVPSCLPHNSLPPFYVSRPSRRSEKWSKKTSCGEALVGPVLPLPVLLTLQQMDKERKGSITLNDELDDDLFSIQCKLVLESVFPEISIADTGNASEWLGSQEMQDEKPFFVYEPIYLDNILACNKTCSSSVHLIGEEVDQIDHTVHLSSEPEIVYKDEKFTTFICGITDTTSCSKSEVMESQSSVMFDLSPVRLDFDSSPTIHPDEEEIFKDLKQKFCTWQESYKPYRDFCTSFKIPKRPY